MKRRIRRIRPTGRPLDSPRCALVTLSCLIFSVLLGAGGAAFGETYIWIDENGVTHLSDGERDQPPETKALPIEEIRSLWSDGLTGPPLLTPPGRRDCAFLNNS